MERQSSCYTKNATSVYNTKTNIVTERKFLRSERFLSFVVCLHLYEEKTPSERKFEWSVNDVCIILPNWFSFRCPVGLVLLQKVLRF